MKIASAVFCFVIALASAKEWKSLTPLVEPLIPKDHLDSKIVGGEVATPHNWPGQVALKTNRGSFCGGALIAPDWVLTAAHCVDMKRFRFVDVVAGAHRINEPEITQQTIRARKGKIIIHEGWNSRTLSNDIALIKLPYPFVLTDEIEDVQYSKSTVTPTAGDSVTAVGWGKDSDDSESISPVLRKVTVPVISSEDVEKVYGPSLNYDTLICIDTTGGMGTCNGDSGGCLDYQGAVVGITSFGASAGCEAGYPACFTRISSFADWIYDKTGIDGVSQFFA